jgi:hypothetical protein
VQRTVAPVCARSTVTVVGAVNVTVEEPWVVSGVVVYPPVCFVPEPHAARTTLAAAAPSKAGAFVVSRLS